MLQSGQCSGQRSEPRASRSGRRSPSSPVVSRGRASDSRRSRPTRSPAASTPSRRRSRGREILTWTNRTSHPASTLQLHLYLNASATRSRRSGASRGGRREPPRPAPESWGSVELTRLTLSSDGTDLLPALRFLAPDDGNPDDRTVAEITLPRPVAPGETVAVAHRLRLAAAAGLAPHGLEGRLLPRRAVVPEDRRPRGGRLELPPVPRVQRVLRRLRRLRRHDRRARRYKGKIGATGAAVSERETSEGRVVTRFRQESVHDFAWTADPDFRVLRDIFREPGIGDVEIKLCSSSPSTSRQADRHFRAAKAGLSRIRPRPRPLSVRDAHDRGPAVGRDAARAAWSTRPSSRRDAPHRAGLAPVAGGRDGPRVRAPVLLRPPRLQRVRGAVARRGVQLLHDRRAC